MGFFRWCQATSVVNDNVNQGRKIGKAFTPFDAMLFYAFEPAGQLDPDRRSEPKMQAIKPSLIPISIRKWNVRPLQIWVHQVISAYQ